MHADSLLVIKILILYEVDSRQLLTKFGEVRKANMKETAIQMSVRFCMTRYILIIDPLDAGSKLKKKIRPEIRTIFISPNSTLPGCILSELPNLLTFLPVGMPSAFSWNPSYTLFRKLSHSGNAVYLLKIYYWNMVQVVWELYIG